MSGHARAERPAVARRRERSDHVHHDGRDHVRRPARGRHVRADRDPARPSGRSRSTPTRNSGARSAAKPEKDVLTVKVKPEAAPMEEWLSLSFDGLMPNGATSMPNSGHRSRAGKMRRRADLRGRERRGARLLPSTRSPRAKADDFRTRAGRPLVHGQRPWAFAEARLDGSRPSRSRRTTRRPPAGALAHEGRQEEGKRSPRAKPPSPPRRRSRTSRDTSAFEKVVADWKAA